MNNAHIVKIPVQLKRSRGLNFNEFFLFLVWPFGALLAVIRYHRTSWAMNLAWLVCGYFGFTFIINLNSLADSTRIAMSLANMHDAGTSFGNLWESFYNPNKGNDIDIVQSLIVYFIAIFTSDSRFLYAVFGLFFGFFYTRNIWYLIEKVNTKLNRFSGLVLITFSMVVAIWDINGFRYYTAVQVFIYGTLPYILAGDKRKLWFTVFSIFIHWSFFIGISTLMVYLLLKNMTKIYFILFVMSFFISILNLDLIRSLFESIAPSFIQETRSNYVDTAYSTTVNEGNIYLRWYVKGHSELLKWFLFVCFSYLYLTRMKIIEKEKSLFNLFNFAMLFFIFVNLFSVVPSVARFYAVANMLCLAVIFLYYQSYRSVLPSWVLKAGIPVLLIFLIIRFRMGLDFMGLLLFFGNPIVIFFVKNSTPLIDFVKMIL